MKAPRLRVLLATLVLCVAALAYTQAAAAFPNGNVFVSVSNGLVNEYTPSGVLVATLDTLKGPGVFTTGLAFDAAGNLYVTDFNGNAVSKFNASGTLLGDFGSGYNADPESILFDSLTNAYVGQAGGSADILKFSAFGAAIGSFSPAVGPVGTDWIDLAPDECTMHYTSEGSTIKRFNVCTNTQLADFATGLPGSKAFAHRILPDGGELVADSQTIKRVNASGAIIQSYDFAGQDSWFALNLDPDGTSFWSADFSTAEVVHFNIATGAVLGNFNTGTGNNTVFGLAVKGELTAATYKLDLTPKTDSNPTGTTHTVTATLTKNGVAQALETINFSVSGANIASGSCVTGISGTCTFTYTGTNVGSDTITATFDKNSDGILEATDTAAKTWTDPLITATGVNVNATEGASFTGTVATFNDPDTSASASEYSATINWGDGSPTSSGTITSTGGGNFTVSGTHTYAEEGTYTVTVTITDVDNVSNTATTTSTATVADAALTASCTNQVSGQVYSGVVATFIDANTGAPVTDFTATISWGDTTSSAGTVTSNGGGSFNVNGTHIYTSTGFFTVVTTINDDGGSTAQTTCTILVGGATAGGSFVIGNLNSAVGTSVTFWGAQWWKLNSLSGGAAPAAFKGFANTPSTNPACGQSWSTDPGNSSGPPDPPLPAFMIVRVSNSISKSGSTISGNTPHLVVVQVNPGYDANPGHAGTGTVVGVLC